MNEALRQLIEKAPESVGEFKGTQYPQLVILAIHGGTPDIAELKAEAKNLAEIDLAGVEHPPREKQIENCYACLCLSPKPLRLLCRTRKSTSFPT